MCVYLYYKLVDLNFKKPTPQQMIMLRMQGKFVYIKNIYYYHC